MVDSISGSSPYKALQPFGGSAPVQPEQTTTRPPQLDLPPPPGPLEQLQDALKGSDIDGEALSRRLTDVFGQGADGVVSDSGVVDLDALKNLIAEERTSVVRKEVTARFGEEATGFVSDVGEIDREGLSAFAKERGIGIDPEQLRPQTGFGGAQVSGYSPKGQATTTAPQNFISVVA